MNRLNLKFIPTVNPTFSWIDWELYDKEGAIAAAASLNHAIKEAVDREYDRNTAQRHVEYEMQRWASVGANDTEAHCLLEECLDAIYSV